MLNAKIIEVIHSFIHLMRDFYLQRCFCAKNVPLSFLLKQLLVHLISPIGLDVRPLCGVCICAINFVAKIVHHKQSFLHPSSILNILTWRWWGSLGTLGCRGTQHTSMGCLFCPPHCHSGRGADCYCEEEEPSCRCFPECRRQSGLGPQTLTENHQPLASSRWGGLSSWRSQQSRFRDRTQ